MKLPLLSLPALVLLASCTHPVGPDHSAPAINLPNRWNASTSPSSPPLAPDWWRSFNDPSLTKLEELALSSNQDLIAAMHRIDEAEASLRIARADFLPSANSNSSTQRSQQSANNNQVPGFQPQAVSQFRTGATLNYELDLWGKVRRAADSRKASLESVVFARDAVQLRLTSNLAEQYFTLRSVDAESAAADQSLTSLRSSLAVAESRYKGGLTSESDVLRARSALSAAEADASDLLKRRNLTNNTIAQLCGQPASSFQSPRNASLPSQIPEPPLNSPASLLRQRPDIAEAERTLASRSADIGVAIGQSLPSLKLNGSLSLESLTFSDLLTQGSRAFSLGPELNLPVFSGGANDARIASAKARHAEAAANWRQAVITAVREVEDALASQSSARLIEQQQRARTDAAARNAALSLERYRNGLVNFLEVADAQQEELSARRALVKATASRLSASVALIKALGGGWQSASSHP
jgi:NodT family efflux transporter outer membrane factor (OMF) lipoprotein